MKSLTTTYYNYIFLIDVNRQNICCEQLFWIRAHVCVFEMERFHFESFH